MADRRMKDPQLSRRDRARAEQAQYERDMEAGAGQRPIGRSPAAIPESEQCPAGLGRRHAITMRGTDGQLRCWYCCRTRAQIQAATS